MEKPPIINEESLLERLRSPGPGKKLSATLDYERLVKSILANLKRMLNTRQGGVPTLPDFGAPEFGDVACSLPDGLAEFQQAIRNTIEKYEPRLRHVRITLKQDEDDLLKLCFEVTAQLAVGKEPALLKFQTLVDSAGQVDIKD
ncbi:MAG: type VI secretion system baseplate subunit TssE [Pseudomonadota bacterium]